jgi:dipeptidyl aminopeptidase/acylaminoacyl peptidase
VTRRLTLDDLAAMQVPTDPAISPDGRHVVYALRCVDQDADRNTQCLWLVDADDPQPRQLTSGRDDSAPRWSPDGTQLAFLRAADGPAQVWIFALDRPGEPRQLTRLPLGAGAPVWSPDGARVAFCASVDLAAQDGEDEEAARRRLATAPIVTDRLGYKADGPGRLTTLRSHLHVTDAHSGETRQLTHGDWGATRPAWDPSGTTVAVVGSLAADSDVTGMSSVHVIDVDHPDARPGLTAIEKGMTAAVNWTPGGTLLAVARPDVAIGHLDLLHLADDGSLAGNLSAALDRNVMAGDTGYPGGLPQVGADGSVLFCARDRGCTHVFRASLDPDHPAPAHVLGEPDEVVSGLSVATSANRAAAVVASPGSYGEVVLVELDTGETRTLTGHTASALPDVELFVAQERTFAISDGGEVHGWLLRDPAAATPGPVLLDVHGGPHNAWSPVPDVGHLYQQILAGHGWTVLILNPRGSDGYGEAFFSGNIGRWGTGDEPDFLEPLDQLVSEGIADPDRLAVTGYSYGGYATCWLTGHTDRFAAAVAGGVVADTVSLTGSDMGVWLSRELGGTAWDDPQLFAQQSPYSSVGRVTTPTLILHGGSDDRCPVGQAEEWFTALRVRGVDTQLVLYPGASHLFILDGRPSHRRDYSDRLVDWVTTHVDGEGK